MSTEQEVKEVVEKSGSIQETPGKFNPNGPGALGFNACATCGTKVDYWGLDRDNRKHFEAEGRCAGFAQAESIEVLLSTIKDDPRLTKTLEGIEERTYPEPINALLETISVYKKLSETLIYIAEHEPRILQAKQQVEGYRQHLQTLFKSAGGFGRYKGFDNDWSFANRLQSTTHVI